MNPQRHRHLTAWLGILAMWFVVLVPMISQLVMADRAHQPIASLCSASQTADTPVHHALDSTLSACGYCDLLATHMAMPPVPTVTPALISLVVAATIPALVSRITPLGAFPSGRPRAPPVSH